MILILSHSTTLLPHTHTDHIRIGVWERFMLRWWKFKIFHFLASLTLHNLITIETSFSWMMFSPSWYKMKRSDIIYPKFKLPMIADPRICFLCQFIDDWFNYSRLSHTESPQTQIMRKFGKWGNTATDISVTYALI